MLKSISPVTRVATTLGVGNTAPATTGAGISFPATQQSSTDPNTLDDYEESTWNPVVTAAGGTITTYTSQGAYTKVGRLVVASMIIDITDKGTGAGAMIATLPFVPGVISTSGAAVEVLSTGDGGKVFCPNGDGNAYITSYNNTSWIQNGYRIVATVSYFV